MMFNFPYLFQLLGELSQNCLLVKEFTLLAQFISVCRMLANIKILKRSKYKLFKDDARCNFVSYARILSYEVVHLWLLGAIDGSFYVQAIFHCPRPSHFKTDSKYFQPGICARSILRFFAASPVEVFYRPYTPPPTTLSLLSYVAMHVYYA